MTISPTVRPSDRLAFREQPAPDPAVPRMELREWADRFGIVAGITTRGGRAGAGDPGFSLGLWSEEHVGQVMSRWRAVRAAVRQQFPGVILAHQVHGTAVQWYEHGTDGWLIVDGIDGHVTGARGTLLTVTVADCVPVYLAVPGKQVVALLHAGWRGTAGQILERGVEVLKRAALVRSTEIVMHCGVGICGACYEVGSEVIERLAPARVPRVNEADAGVGTPGRRPAVHRADGPSSHVDLREILARQASELGVAEVSVSPWCSAHDRDHFFSHRASGGRDGRMIAYVGLPATGASPVA